MDLYEVVTKLVGPVEPVGETREDDRRYENLKQLVDLTGRLLFDIDAVRKNKDRHEYSMKRAGECAEQFFDDVRGEMQP